MPTNNCQVGLSLDLYPRCNHPRRNLTTATIRSSVLSASVLTSRWMRWVNWPHPPCHRFSDIAHHDYAEQSLNLALAEKNHAGEAWTYFSLRRRLRTTPGKMREPGKTYRFVLMLLLSSWVTHPQQSQISKLAHDYVSSSGKTSPVRETNSPAAAQTGAETNRWYTVRAAEEETGISSRRRPTSS